MKLVVLVAVLGVALAAPQALDPDAETVFTPEESPLPPQDVGNGTIIIINPSFFDILRGLFGGGDVFEDGDPVDAPPQDSGRFPSLFDHPLFNVFRGPFLGGSPDSPPVMTRFDGLPDNYDNSTHEVKVVNGSRVEVNRTITKQTGDNGILITHFHSVRRLPGADGEPVADDGGQAPETEAVPDGNTAENRVDPSETSGVSEVPSMRHRRWILKWLRKAIKRSSDHKHDMDTHESHLNGLDLPSDKDVYSVGAGRGPGSEEATSGGDHTLIIPIRKNDDIAVNYIVPRPDNPDAEVIDLDLIREDKRRFFESRAGPLTSQAIRSQPMMSQPIRSQPMMSQPIRSQPMMSQPIRSQPMMSQPIRSQPIRL